MKRLLRFVPACVACVGLTAAAEDADLFKQLDTSGDGVVEKSEVGEDRVRFFDRLIRVGDENGDGKLSQAEFDAALSDKPAATPQPDFGARRGAGDRGAGRPGGFPGGREMPAPEEIIERLDKNGDGKVQRDELTGRAEMLGRIMDRMDTDELTADQLRDVGQRMREMMGQGRPDGGRPDGGRPEMARREGDQPEGAKPEGERRPRDRGWEQAFGDRERGPRERGPGGEDMARRGGPDRGFGGLPRGDHPPMGGGPAFMKVLDEDGDGQITKLEAVRLIEKFTELDKNEDGKLQPNELFGGDRPMGPPMFGRVDGDRGRDGDRPGRGRPDMERDGDRPEAGRPGPPEGRGFGMRGGRGGFGGGGPEAFFERLDADGNGSISKEEMPSFLSDRFGMFDKNDDGEITKDEFQRPEGGRFGGRGPGRDGDRPKRPAEDDAA